MNISNIQTVVCPEGYEFVKPHKKGNGVYVAGYCRKTDKQQQKELAKETIEAIPFGFDVSVGYDYIKYGKKRIKNGKRRL